MPNFISEDDIEIALITLLQESFNYEVLNCYTIKQDDINDGSRRTDKRDVIFGDRLMAALIGLNPSVPESTLGEVVNGLMDRRSSMEPIAANMDLDNAIRNGVAVSFIGKDGKFEHETVRLIDFENADSKNNQFLAVQQLWIKSIGTAPFAAYRRPDVILYVNGIPLVFIELKNSNVALRNAFDDNLKKYRNDIPQLFHCNAFCILSNATETRVGSFTAGWEHFFNWFRVNFEDERVDRKDIADRGTSLEYALWGLCIPAKLLDYIENFVLFYKKETKIIAQNHQFMGVNNAYLRFLNRKEEQGKLGVFWHTQGSGKSFSMIFYARKILRKVKGNFSFVVVTDRTDLDGQIYRNFINTATISENDAAQPKDAEEMRKFLGMNKKVVFTLIQKFRYDKGKSYPKLFNSDEREVIVMVDEAHRTQYKSLAENMRVGLAGANFLAFTGTPLLGKGEKTSDWFGGYVSEYNFQQAMEDQATVPLFYEKRVPEMLIQNDDLSDEFYELLEDENLDDAQQEKLEKRYSSLTTVITRDSRLDTIAADIAYHFPRRGYLGKGMVITLDKFTAVKMFEKVQYHWKKEITRLRGIIKQNQNSIESEQAKQLILYMKSVEMAVVISDPRSDSEKFSTKGMNIELHIKRLEQLDENGHDIEYNFKDPKHPLQLVFVCAMWLTGFDAPSVSTLYLDKPMKGHTLMQTIARANRVASYKALSLNGKPVEKKNGEIVDYFNVFHNMKDALNEYTRGAKGNSPVQDKSQLFILLDSAVNETVQFCLEYKVDLHTVIEQNETFKNIALFEQFADVILEFDERRKSFYVYENTVTALFEACKPEILGDSKRPLIEVIQYLRGVIDSHIGSAEIEKVVGRIDDLLDESVVVDRSDRNIVKEGQIKYQIIQKGKQWDLSRVNFDELHKGFKETEYKNIMIAEIKAFIEEKLRQMLEQNSTRVDFAQRLQQIIEEYNAGGSSNENYFDELVKFSKGMKEEDERHIREGLTEDELELYDTLKKEKLTKAEEIAVKNAAKHLITRLLKGHPKVFVQDWWKDGQTLQKVKSAIEEVLDETLPQSYDSNMFKEKCDSVVNLIVDFAVHGRKWVG